MDGTGRQQKNFVGYEYKEIATDSSRFSFLLDGYESFGWEEDGSLTEGGTVRSPAMQHPACCTRFPGMDTPIFSL